MIFNFKFKDNVKNVVVVFFYRVFHCKWSRWFCLHSQNTWKLGWRISFAWNWMLFGYVFRCLTELYNLSIVNLIYLLQYKRVCNILSGPYQVANYNFIIINCNFKLKVWTPKTENIKNHFLAIAITLGIKTYQNC